MYIDEVKKKTKQYFVVLTLLSLTAIYHTQFLNIIQKILINLKNIVYGYGNGMKIVCIEVEKLYIFPQHTYMYLYVHILKL